MAKQVKDEIQMHTLLLSAMEIRKLRVRRYAEDNGFSDSLHITGWVDNPMSYVELFDVACLLSRWEGFGLALPEYMMAGKPIVAKQSRCYSKYNPGWKMACLLERMTLPEQVMLCCGSIKEDGLKDRLVTQGFEDVHNRFNARRVSEEHGKLLEQIVR